MKPLAHWPLAARRNLTGVFTDIDDTLTTAGKITSAALEAMGALCTQGLTVIAITGRPLGWSEAVIEANKDFHITGDIKSFPAAAVVSENGAAAHILNKNGIWLSQNIDSLLSKSYQKIYQQEAATRSSQYLTMQRVAQRVLREVPTARLSQDSAGRETDIAFDHSEFTHLSDPEIASIVKIMQSEGMNATVSSIHINGWFGEHNKLSGARWMVRELFSRDLNLELDQWAFVGDSTNDQLMFEAFSNSIGVANVLRFEAALEHQPRYICQGERGAGFAEVTQAILSARSSDSGSC